MQQASEGQLDFVEELRLRSWARLNHVPAEQRLAAWHPVVLDEMRRRDADGSTFVSDTNLGALYVPLVPTSTYMVHPGHSAIPEPHFSREGSLTERYYIG
jgi:hypothetical protein